MAHPLSQVLPRSGVIPRPVSPVIRDGYRRRLTALLVFSTLMWCLAFAFLAFVSVPILIDTDGNILEMVMVLTDLSAPYASNTMIVTVLVEISLLSGAITSLVPVKNYIRRWAGYCPREGFPDKAGQGLNWIPSAPIAIGFATGLLTMSIGSAVRGELLTAAAEVVVFVVVAYATQHVIGRALATVKRFKATADLHAQIISNGYHSVATVTKTRLSPETVDDRSEFTVTLASRHGGELTTITATIIEHPIWAPVPGTEFDVWTTDTRTLDIADADRVIIERRYLGHDGPADPYLYQITSDEFTQRMGPTWMSSRRNAIARNTAEGKWRWLLQGIALTIRFLGTFSLLALIAILALADAQPSTIVLFLPVTIISIADTFLAVARMYRARWYIRNQFPIWTIIAAWLAQIIFTASALSPDDVLAENANELTAIGEVALGISIALMTLAVFLIWPALYPPQLFNRGFEAPAEAMQQAMTSHDPTLADRLEAATGVRVGVALTQWKFVTD